MHFLIAEPHLVNFIPDRKLSLIQVGTYYLPYLTYLTYLTLPYLPYLTYLTYATYLII